MKQLLKVTFSDEHHTVDITMLGDGSRIKKVQLKSNPAITTETIKDSLAQSFAIGYANSLLDLSEDEVIQNC